MLTVLEFIRRYRRRHSNNRKLTIYKKDKKRDPKSHGIPGSSGLEPLLLSGCFRPYGITSRAEARVVSDVGVIQVKHCSII